MCKYYFFVNFTLYPLQINYRYGNIDTSATARIMLKGEVVDDIRHGRSTILHKKEKTNMMKSDKSAVERMKMIKAMEFIARQINDEEVFDRWLLNGVCDGEVEYGDLTICSTDKENLSYYLHDDEFANIMGLFLRIMHMAYKSGGLYCDDVCSAD